MSALAGAGPTIELWEARRWAAVAAGLPEGEQVVVASALWLLAGPTVGSPRT